MTIEVNTRDILSKFDSSSKRDKTYLQKAKNEPKPFKKLMYCLRDIVSIFIWMFVNIMFAILDVLNEIVGIVTQRGHDMRLKIEENEQQNRRTLLREYGLTEAQLLKAQQKGQAVQEAVPAVSCPKCQSSNTEVINNAPGYENKTIIDCKDCKQATLKSDDLF